MQEHTIHFGPAGNSASFYAQGHKHSDEAPGWLAAQGLNAYEYSSGRGVNLTEETARRIGEQAKLHGVAVSIHAPYFINLANPEPERYEKNRAYILDAARALDWMGGTHVVVHVGSHSKMDPDEAFRNVLDGLKRVRAELVDEGLAHIRLCPETMGKDAQIGGLDDILRLCEIDDSFLPTIDFAHLHARGRGAITTTDDFARILDRMEEVLGAPRAHCFHAHFCHIEFTGAGEKRHWTFADEQFGPDFALLAPLIAARGLTPTLICESKDTMAEDACEMKRLVEQHRR